MHLDNFISHWYVLDAKVIAVLYYRTLSQVVILPDYVYFRCLG